MYFSKKTHLLSYAIMASAVIRLAGSAAESLIRTLLNKTASLLPDMLDAIMWKVQTVSSGIQIILIALVFYLSWKKMNKLKGLIAEEDRAELGRLQEEALGEHLSSLSANDVGKLIKMWAIILIGAEFVYFLSSVIYRRFTLELMLLVISSARYESFTYIYNMSHGFKYLEMMTALLLGVIMTGIFLGDGRLKIVAAVIAAAFLLSFGLFQMTSIDVSGKLVGIVWTSVIFHFTETVGLFVLAVYLAKHYRGL